MANSAAETAVGAVVLAIAAGFFFYAGQTSGLQVTDDSYALVANFRSVEGISVGTDVRLAGIKVGTVTALDLDRATYRARAVFTVEKGLEIPEDSDVKIASEGLLGGSYVEITPGASDFMVADGDELVNTQGSVSLLNLLMRFGTDSK
ncbi:outer membrane lipid asymmetry maintenance protein MlaD [Rhodobacteraceae bacterium DSL-40]|uniref:outer membrane lipid asymmetry maintenance protein MlaD n=1 Tax=Amaricoccus sp. B4 TaxID=3368557 RepID=UPI000DACAC88